MTASHNSEACSSQEAQHVRWSGELLWPCTLQGGQVIDMSGVEALGSWVHSWLRHRGPQRVVGAAPKVRQQLMRAGLPIQWEEGASDTGVTASERSMLWGET
jgi:hypothetical protein